MHVNTFVFNLKGRKKLKKKFEHKAFVAPVQKTREKKPRPVHTSIRLIDFFLFLSIDQL